MKTFCFANRATANVYEFLADAEQHRRVSRLIDRAFENAADDDTTWNAGFDDYFVVARALGHLLNAWLSPRGMIDRTTSAGELLDYLAETTWEEVDLITVSEALLCRHRRWAPADAKYYPYVDGDAAGQ